MTELRRRRGQPPNESRRGRVPVSLGGQPLSGEMQLALAVLEDCVRRLVSSRGCHTAPLRRDLAWIESRERRAPFAFEHLCEVLQIDAERLRRRVLTAVGPAAEPPVGPTERAC